jgi:YHS domain-containing protein
MNKTGSMIKEFKLVLFVFLISVLITITGACNQQPQAVSSPAVLQQQDSIEKKFTAAMVDNRKDPNCGMPVTAGIEDTVHYNGKVYGFCSEQCKQAFLKNPTELAKNAELK